MGDGQECGLISQEVKILQRKPDSTPRGVAVENYSDLSDAPLPASVGWQGLENSHAVV